MDILLMFQEDVLEQCLNITTRESTESYPILLLISIFLLFHIYKILP